MIQTSKVIRRRVLCIIFAAMATPVWADQNQGDAAVGQELFSHHCAVCHGIEGTGAGPMAPVMLVQPADLTELAAGNGGVLPVARIAARIDGRDPLVSHGSTMPVYGDFFEGEDVSFKTQSGQPMITSRPIADLIAYLDSLQGI